MGAKTSVNGKERQGISVGSEKEDINLKGNDQRR